MAGFVSLFYPIRTTCFKKKILFATNDNKFFPDQNGCMLAQNSNLANIKPSCHTSYHSPAEKTLFCISTIKPSSQ